MSNEPEVIDLDKEREARAAAREGRGQGMPIILGGKVIATLPSELPIDVLAPLKDIDEALMLLLREAMSMATGADAAQRWQATNLVIDLFSANSRLPVVVLGVVRDIGVNLLGQEGFDAFVAARPSKEDVGALAKAIFNFYGVSLGEPSPSSDSSSADGGTSSTTSSANSTDSMPEASTDVPENRAS